MTDQGSRRITYTIIILAILNLIANTFVVLLIQDEYFKLLFTDIAFPFGNFLTVCILFLAAFQKKTGSRRAFYAWLTIGIGHAFYMIADIIWAYLELGSQQVPYPSIADFFYIFYYPLFLVGILLFPYLPYSRMERIKFILDAGVIVLASLMGLWFFLLGPIIQISTGESPLIVALNLYYPTADILLLCAALTILYRRISGQNAVSMLLLAASCALTIVIDGIYSYQTVLDAYVSGSALDLGWLYSYFIVLAAAAWDILQPAHTPEPVSSSTGQLHPPGWISYVQYAWVIGAFLMLVYYDPRDRSQEYTILLWGVGLVILIVMLRQVLTLEENRKLTNRLRYSIRRSQEQHSLLAQSNLELESEIKIRKHIEAQLRHDAFHDGLTGLPNRTYFLDRLARAIEFACQHPSYQFSVFLIDLDEFKAINDSRGHPVGDRFLISVASVMTNCLRSTDTIARFGGDEFILLIEHNDFEGEPATVANRILGKLRQPILIDLTEIHITASIGIVIYDPTYLNANDIIRDADIALYQAKANGKARYQLFHPELRLQMVTRMGLEKDLRAALDHNELEIFYQPILSLQTHRITGVEALLRWRHPRRGLVLPSEFIYIAEEMGLLHEIGKRVILQASAQVSDWHHRYPLHPPLTLSVNISASQINKPDFTGSILAALETTGLPGSCLNIEITESMYLNITEATLDLFKHLKSHGIKIHIDDFGTGYSSLSFLHRCPVDTIKIDRAFISSINNQAAVNIVQTIINLAHDLSMETIAEGVETIEQLDYLVKHQCDFAQGFLFYKPMEPGAVEELLKSPPVMVVNPQRAAGQQPR